MKRGIIVFFVLVFCSIVFSQFLPIRTYFTDDGLASSQVWSIVEDNKGYIWFGCSSGISRFNGFRFKNFRLKEGLPSESINKLLPSNSGFIIAQTLKGLAYLPPNSEKFTSIPDIGEISDITIKEEFYDYRKKKRYPTIFAIIKNKGIAAFTIGKGRWKKAKFADLQPISLLFFNGAIIFCSSDGTIYQTDSLMSKAKKIGKSELRTKIKKNGKKILLISEHSVNLLQKNKVKPLFKTPTNEEIIFDATIDISGNLWIATNLGLRKKTEKNTYLYTSKNGLPGIRVLSTFQSSEGILWFGTNHGVCKLVSEDMLVYRETGEANASSYICFYYDKQKETMMIGNTSGVMLIKKNKISHIKSPYLKKFPVWDIEKDKKGNFYFATEGGGLVKISPSGEETHYRTDHNHLPGNNVTDILLKNKTLYIACKEGFAVLKNGKWEKHSISSGLPVSYIRCIEEYKNSRILLGSLGAGILVYRNGKISNLLPTTPKELKSVFDLYFDKKNNTIWAATNYGLAKIKNKKITFYNTKNGFLPFGLSAVYPVKNYLWIGSDGGAQLFDPQKERVIRILTKDDGLPGNEFTTHNAIIKDPYNNIWFGFFGGAAKIENLGLKLNINKEFNPRIFPTAVKYYYRNKSIVKNAFSNQKITIPYGAREIFISFDVIWFKNEYTLKLEYKLEGINAVWNRINDFKNMKVYYTNLKPGVYPLYIKASSISTNKTVSKKVLEINTPSPWWQQKKFQILLLFGILVSIYLVILMFTEYKTRKLKKEKAKLDELVRKKTIQLDLLNKELQKKNEILKDLSEHDPLTGLYNRRYLTHLLEVYKKSVFRDEKTDACLLLFDIDFFKKINDTYGHDAGDKVLQTVAKTMVNSIRKSDVAVRFGGEEFLIILTKLEKDNTLENAFKVAEKIRKRIENTPIKYLNKEIKITISGGVSCFDLKEFTKENLYKKLKEVDKKLYKAKNSGRNIIII